MKYFQFFFLGLGSFFLASEAGPIDERNLSPVSDRGTVYQANKFKCPFPFGVFPDTEDCAHFYACFGGAAVRRKCGMFLNFCSKRKRCMPKFVAVCGGDGIETTPSVIDEETSTAPDEIETTPSVTAEETSTTPGDNFKCNKYMGSFPHPNDCSKYYYCMAFKASLKTCPEKQLFDRAHSSCKPEEEVDCDTRQRPGFLTSEVPNESTITEVSEIINTEKDIIQTTTETISSKEIGTGSITEINNTIRPTGPPDHNCDEDDVDCIITETGDVEDWFLCPRDIGSFPHPSSDKLFIFCMNWIPSAKKCGVNLVYSKERSTCIETAFL